MKKFSLSAEKRTNFDVTVHRGAFEKDIAHDFLDFGDRKCVLVATPTVWQLYGESVLRSLKKSGTIPDVLVLELGEQRKFIPAVVAVAQCAQRVGLDRRGLLIALGGGVVGDIVGFAASMIRRGVGHARIPTTLMAQIDAAIGIKGGVNFNQSKNYLGCFHPPEAVLVDPGLLRSLPVAAVRQGMAEIVKIAMIRDDRLFGMLEERGETLIGTRFAQPVEFAEDVITRSIDGMLVELSCNPYENMTLERFVDLGHMISPALEAQSGYKLHQGEAVAVDLAYTSCIANEVGHLSDADLLRIIGLIRQLGLPTNHTYLDESLVLRSFADTEKHRGGALNLPVPTGIGTCDFIRYRNELAEGTVSRALVRLAETEDMFSDIDLRVVS